MSLPTAQTALVPSTFDWALVVYLAVVTPVLVWRKVRGMRKRIASGDSEARSDLYRSSLAEQWLVSAVLLFGWWRLARPLDELGLVFPGGGGAVAAWVLCLVGVALLVLQARLVARSEQARQQLRDQLGGPEGELGSITPWNRRELRWFAAVSVTAGVNEELVYRGFLMALLGSLGGPVLAVAGSTAIFALGHVYQPRHLHRVASVGLVMALLYLLGGSVVPVMILHAAIDLSSGWISWRVAAPLAGTREVLVPAAD